MRGDVMLATLVVLLGGLGTWLLLPHRLGRIKPRRTQGFGALFTIVALILLSGFYAAPGGFLQNAFFYVFATAAVAGGIATITSRNPVYSALWFASVVLSTSGLFLLAGAQFLAAGTVIVYAGAIIVTFLFVIMLAQSEGQAIYDRMARAPGAATFSAFVLLWAVFYALLVVRTPEDATRVKPTDFSRLPSAVAQVDSGRVRPNTDMAAVIARSISSTARLGGDVMPGPGTPPPHVAGLGATLFTDHLLAIELAGAILFMALIGAIAIATPKAPIRPVARDAIAAGDPSQSRALQDVTL